MQFEHGGIRYRVRIGDVRQGDLAHISHTAGVITLSGTHPARHLPSTLAHELAHAIVMHTPPPADVYGEEYADWLGAQMLTFHRRMVEQGGEDTLLAKYAAAGGQVGADDSEVPMVPPVGRECSECKTTIAPGSVVNRGPRMHESGQPVVVLEWYCEHCDEVEQVTFARTFGNLPSGVPIGEPSRITSPSKVREWCKAHPLQAGQVVYVDDVDPVPVYDA